MKQDRRHSEILLRGIVASVCAICIGCDVEIPSLRKATEQVAEYSSEQLPKEPLEPVAAQIDNERASLEHYAASRVKMLEAVRVQTEKELSGIIEDRRVMSGRVSELADKAYSKKDAGFENALLLFLKDEMLNSLATRYLGSDFSIVRNEFVAKIRETYRQSKMRMEALAANRKVYDGVVEESVGRAALSKKSAEDEIRRLQSGIRDKERRIGYLRNMGMASRQEKERRGREIVSLESEIGNMKQNLNRVRSNIDRSSSELVRNRALRQLNDSDREVERRFEGMVPASKVAEDYECLTVKRLDTVMREKEAAVKDRKGLLEAQVTFISSVASGLDKLGVQSLKKIREEIDRALNWNAQDARKRGLNVGR